MNEPTPHQRAFDLLPWLVNGSLPSREREALEEHLRNCLPCRRELKAQQRLRRAVRSQPAVHLSPQGGFDELARRLGRASVRPQPTQWHLAPLARFAVVGIAGVALLGFLFWLTPTGRDGGGGVYSTLASPPASGAALDVIFAQSVTAAEMQALLDAIDGEIAAGPTDLGRYTVRLEGADASARREAALAMLRTDPRVRFAGPTLSEPAP